MNPNPTFPAFLFDYNGVLVDDEEVHLEAFQGVLAPLGLHITRADYWEKYLGFDDSGAFDAILRAAGQPPSEDVVAELVAAKKPVYMRLASEGLKTFEGAGALIGNLAQEAVVGVVSGALREEIELGLRALEVRDSVSFIVAAEDTARSKPDPEGYLLGVERVRERRPSIDTAAILAIEDSLAGVESAKAAGLRCLAVCHSYPENELRKSGADAVVSGISDVTPEVIASLQRSYHA